MSQNNNKLKPKFFVPTNKKKRLIVQIPQKLNDLISEYREFHKVASGEEVSLDSLISAFISAAVTSDKNFTKWKKTRGNTQSDNVIL